MGKRILLPRGSVVKYPGKQSGYSLVLEDQSRYSLWGMALTEERSAFVKVLKNVDGVPAIVSMPPC